MEEIKENVTTTIETDTEGSETKPFKPIESQEALDAIIKDRIARERKKSSETSAEFQRELEKSKSLIAELNAKVSEFDSIAKENEELKASVRKHEIDSAKTKISLELGIPVEMASRIQGETEEDIRTDAEILLKSMPKIQKSAPQKSTSTVITEEDSIKNEYRDMLKNL